MLINENIEEEFFKKSKVSSGIDKKTINKQFKILIENRNPDKIADFINTYGVLLDKHKFKTIAKLAKFLQLFDKEKYDNLDLNWIDISNIKNLKSVFYSYSLYDFNCDISKWDVSHITNMEYAFANCCRFNQDLNGWDVSKVTNMSHTFYGCTSFNKPLDKWDVSKVTTMMSMFNGCENFNQDINSWNVGNAINMSNMFSECSKFNMPLDKWDMSNVTITENMFEGCLVFNQNLNSWNVENLTYANYMFDSCFKFNQPLDKWNLKNIVTMDYIFYGCKDFDQDLNSWSGRINNLESADGMFLKSGFSHDLKLVIYGIPEFGSSDQYDIDISYKTVVTIKRKIKNNE